MSDRPFRNSVRYWRTPLLPGADMVTAEYLDHEFAPHWHDAYTIPVIEAGAEMFDYLGSHHVAETGTVPVINPGELHTGSRATEHGWQYRVCYVPVDFVQGLADDIAGRAQPLPWFPADVIRDPDLARRVSIAHRLLEAAGDLRGGNARCGDPRGGHPPGGDPLAAEAALIDALSTLLVRHAGNEPEPARLLADNPRVETMKARLAADLSEPVTLTDLAQAVGLSAFHAARLFTRETGLPPHAWRNQVRLQRALGPLRAGVSVAEVAAATGFTDQSHFTRHFRRMFGVPPGRWQSR
ncbi:AraC family transcriptional regulator [Trinickia sp. YCB016]